MRFLRLDLPNVDEDPNISSILDLVMGIRLSALGHVCPLDFANIMDRPNCKYLGYDTTNITMKGSETEHLVHAV